ncbi:hypothetical protein [Belnapia sp. F-4-1]|uniref:hypothetical protein n=1 Tax=Belnapia sp. F-4-1 TaxID=1545443 RepID=UPI0005B97685|nr:hypothetical protein [Belnapia sp. F-4-1]
MDEVTVISIDPRQKSDILPVLHGLLKLCKVSLIEDDIGDEWVAGDSGWALYDLAVAHGKSSWVALGIVVETCI